MDNGKTSIPSLYLVNPEKLSPHPLLTQYFPDGSDEERDDLKESIKTVGILHPIVAKKNGEIISGRQRWRAAKEAGLKSVPVRFMDFKQPEQEEAAMIAANVFVRWLSPNVVARNKERLLEIWRQNGRGVFKGGDIPNLTPAQQRAVKRHIERVVADTEKNVRARVREQAAEESQKRLKGTVQERQRLEKSLEEVMEERDKSQQTLLKERQERKEEEARLCRKINSTRTDKDQQKKELQAVQKELEKLRARVGKSSRQIEKSTGGLEARGRRLLALTLQISRIGPEVLMPAVIGLLEGRERRKEIIDALHKLNEWSKQMEGAVEQVGQP